MSERLDALHCLRGLAALSVCFGHIVLATPYVFPPSVAAVTWLGRFAVPAFFLVSGFVVPFSLLGRGYSIRAYPRFVARRVIRLDPPYFAALGLGLLLALAITVSTGTPFPYHASDVALHVGYLSGLAGRPWILSPFWTLGIEFQFYLLMGLIVAAVIPLGRQLTTPAWRGPIFIGLLLAGFFALCEIEWRLVPHLTYSQVAASWLTYKAPFLLGMLALLVRRLRLSVFWLVAVAPIIFGWDHMQASLLAHRSPDWASLAVDCGGLVGMAVVTVCAPTSWPWLRQRATPLVWLGTISYSLYVTHILIAGRIVSRLVAHNWMPTAALGLWLVVSIELALCLCLAAGFYQLVELPALRWSRRIQLTKGRALERRAAIAHPVEGSPRLTTSRS